MNIRLLKRAKIKLTHYRYSRGVCLHRHPLTFLHMTRLGFIMDNMHSTEKSLMTIDYDHIGTMSEAELWRHLQVFNNWRNVHREVKVADATPQQCEYLRYGLKVKSKLKSVLRAQDINLKL